MKILVGLDLSSIDQHLIGFLKRQSNKLGVTEKVTFLHVKNEEVISDELRVMFSYGSDSGKRCEVMTKRLEAYGSPELTQKSEVITAEGNIVSKINDHIVAHETDLIILGRKRQKKATGVATHRLAQTASSDILLIPNRSVDLKNILVPIDFSKHSKKAFERALSIARKTEQSSVHCIHVYRLPTDHEASGKSVDEIDQIIKGRANQQIEEFLKAFDISDVDVVSEAILDKGKGYAKTIKRESVRRKVDMVIMGSKGPTYSAWILLGGVAERMILLTQKIPLMIVKLKGENSNLLNTN